jgi:hypothetical protein
MTSRLPLLIVLGVLAGPVRAGAACHWFGTQLDCRVGDSRLVIGSQTADPTRSATSLRPQTLQGDGGLLARRPAPAAIGLSLQDVGTDPSLCRRIGNEGYCY